MNRWVTRVAWIASLSAALAALPAAIAFAEPPGHEHQSGHGRRGVDGPLKKALELPSLTQAQHDAIEQLIQAERSARVPVRQANAQLLTALAQQVESGAIDEQALASSTANEQGALRAERAAHLETFQKLHAILTSAQRSELVDALEAMHHPEAADGGGGWRAEAADGGGGWRAEAADGGGGWLAEAADGGGGWRAEAADGGGGGWRMAHGLRHLADRLGLSADQREQIAAKLSAERSAAPRGDADAQDLRATRGEGRKAWLEAFRGDVFNPPTPNVAPRSSSPSSPTSPHARVPGQRIEHLIEVALPVLTPAQRTELATLLRERASREGRG